MLASASVKLGIVAVLPTHYQAFDAHAAAYDAWYDSAAGSTIFAMEVDCLRPLLSRHQRPYLEVGIGSGRFAQAIGVEYGLDPAIALLRMAKSRGIQVVRVTGEALPLASNKFGAVLIALTLCFVDKPRQVLQEARRVLLPGGGLVLGLILKGSPWAEFYADKGKAGHPLYGKAQFFSQDEIETLLYSTGFQGMQYCSVLFQPPGRRLYHPEQQVKGYQELAGFVALRSCKPGTENEANR